MGISKYTEIGSNSYSTPESSFFDSLSTVDKTTKPVTTWFSFVSWADVVWFREIVNLTLYINW